MMKIPLAETPQSQELEEDPRLHCLDSYLSWVEAKAPLIPPEPPLPIPDEGFLRRIRA